MKRLTFALGFCILIIANNFQSCRCIVLSTLSSESSSSFNNSSCTNDSPEYSNVEKVQRPTISFGMNRAPSGSIEHRNTDSGDLTGVQCNSTKPIGWAFYTTTPFNFNNDQLTTANNYFGRVIKNIGNVTVTIYQADLDLYYFRKEMNSINITIACETIENENPCEKSYIKFNNVSQDFDVVQQPSLIPVRKEFIPSYLNPETSLDCKTKLLIQQTKENDVIYKWMPTLNNSKPTHQKTFSYNNPVSFWNAFKDFDNDFECSEYSSTLKNCSKNCKTVKYFTYDILEKKNVTANAIAFYAKINGVPVVQKGLYSIHKENDFRKRIFLMLHDVTFSDMMYLDLRLELMYTEKEYLVTCWVSTFYFSVGTIISIYEDPIQELMKNDTRNIKEVYSTHNSARKVTRTMKFTAEYGNTNQTMTCFAPKIYSSDWHNDSRSIYVETSSFPKFVGDEEEEFVVDESYVNFTLSCAFQGTPTPEIYWELPTPDLEAFVTRFSNEMEHFSESIITFPHMMANFTGLYTCVGKNFRGNVTKTFTVNFPPNELSFTVKVSLGVSIGAAVLIFISVVLLLVRRLKIEERLFRIQAEEVMNEFRQGCILYSKDAFDSHFSILQQPYNTEYEVPLEQWFIGTRVLGSGEFGVVKQGTVQIENSKITVAVKTTKKQLDIADFKAFLDELKIMAYIGSHENCCSLIAAFSNDDNNARNVLIGVEFCGNGSLLDYIITRKGAFQNMVNPEGCLTTEFNEQTIEQAKVESPELTTANLYTWSYQIANGLEYLAEKKVLHSDLAARNVLLSSNIVAKISDFGLSKILQNADNYTKKTRCPLPWKWMAIESLRDMEFSPRSDMWAYGVTLWELFTLCESPWSDQSWSLEFIAELGNGRRLSKPVGATNNIYNKIMLPAWHPIPDQRLLPTAAKELFRNVLQGSFKDG